MWTLRRTSRREGAAVAEDLDADRLRAEIDRLSASRRSEDARRLVSLRHLLGMRLLDEAGPPTPRPEPDYELLADHGPLPEVDQRYLTPELLRAAILRHGCLLVRALVARRGRVALRQADRAVLRRARPPPRRGAL